MRRYCCSLLALLPMAVLANSDDLNRVLRQAPASTGFEICYGGGCAGVANAVLDEADWLPIRQLFQPSSADAAQERARISQAIGLMEQAVGRQTGTNEDRAGTFVDVRYKHQLDCNDEAANTKTYLKLLQQAGYLIFHDIIDTKTRGFFLNGWPHTTAAIQEKQGSQRYAVDAWFYDNGQPAVIVPLEQWKSGWKPADSPAR
jgi:hypothetical protein